MVESHGKECLLHVAMIPVVTQHYIWRTVDHKEV